MLLGILLAIHIIVCIALIGVILLQRSEGGALGMGGGNSDRWGTGPARVHAASSPYATCPLTRLPKRNAVPYRRNGTPFRIDDEETTACSTAPWAAPASRSARSRSAR
ncbi:preprotein translocase subunit SecG, partial [Streptomyces sp. 4F14]|uniref:preprotein translocase subunit SecG n=1 Tax=Streptomyces sp. 4F14 TaxID=3394380 RepID=UPI003A856296